MTPKQLITKSKLPRRPWVLSKQYGMTLVLSQDNEIILGVNACEKLGDDVCRFIIDSVNAREERKHPP